MCISLPAKQRGKDESNSRDGGLRQRVSFTGEKAILCYVEAAKRGRGSYMLLCVRVKEERNSYATFPRAGSQEMV